MEDDPGGSDECTGAGTLVCAGLVALLAAGSEGTSALCCFELSVLCCFEASALEVSVLRSCPKTGSPESRRYTAKVAMRTQSAVPAIGDTSPRTPAKSASTAMSTSQVFTGRPR